MRLAAPCLKTPKASVHLQPNEPIGEKILRCDDAIPVRGMTGATEELARNDLVLRPWRISDAESLRAAIDEDLYHLKPWMSWTLDEPSTLASTRRRLRRWVAAFEAKEGYRYAIVSHADPLAIIGGANLNLRFGPNAYDVGYWVRKSATHRGIASAAVARLAVLAFDERSMKRLVLQCDVANAASAAFAKALGFVFVGEAVVGHANGLPRPVFLFTLTRERYVDVRHQFIHKASRVRLIER
jgi:RimJ/RimL family protein N-acetyltransferase